MVQFSSLINSLAKSISTKNERTRTDIGREAVDALAKEAKKNDMMLSSPRKVSTDGSKCSVSIYSKKGKKGVNQDSFIVWEEFGCQEDMTFCGVFDGHGPWGHIVAKKVRELMPLYLLCEWQEALALSSMKQKLDSESYRSLQQLDIWKQSYLRTCATIDQELEQHFRLYSFHSGTTALAIVRLGDLLVIANIGDSRAVLATTSDAGSLLAVQLTIDHKPNLPQEIERIKQSKGKVFSLDDEPGVYRVWAPQGETPGGPGLALSRAFGDCHLKNFGLISEPEVTGRKINSRDQFVILATDGVWDVISNQEAVCIVSSSPNMEESARRLVECAASAWKKRGNPMDDITAVCLFFHNAPTSPQILDPLKTSQFDAAMKDAV